MMSLKTCSFVSETQDAALELRRLQNRSRKRLKSQYSNKVDCEIKVENNIRAESSLYV